jgi:hypothetical protein
MRGRHALLALAMAMALTTALAAPAGAVPPAPCGGTAQITDPAGDGHHPNTDVTAGWLSEANGRLQAVIQVTSGVWSPAHEDSETADWTFLFEVAGRTAYVRATGPRSGVLRYDFGSWTGGGGFASAGPTTGEVTPGGNGAVTIDVPAATGAVPGAVLARPFILTWDGAGADGPHWVDGAPGGVRPETTDRGADFVVGSCSGQGSGGGAGGGARTTAVTLQAPKRLKGGGRALVSGRVTPARAGVPVALSARGRRTTTRRLTTAADGTFATSMRISETSRLRAEAEGIGSQTRTVRVLSRVRIKVRRLSGGGALITGTVRPRLPGRVLLLRTTDARPTKTTRARNGRFRIRLARPRKGRYQAVYIPSGRRAERSTSNTGAIR